MAELGDDYVRGLGLKVGLEIHQQLRTRKLFCNCESMLRTDPPDITAVRRLHAVGSELGTEDAAALEESLKEKKFTYEAYDDTCCLVELDEEPPRGPNPEALNIGLLIAKSLNVTLLDELQVMRKTIVDGSCTSGFQKTILLGAGGKIKTLGGKDVSIESVCLEEDAAKIVGENSYRLDRLAIPLVEIATGPDMKTPHDAVDAARTLGLLLRSSGKVMRGIGTIRQDLNVSINSGARVEIKGVQELRIMPQVIGLEVERQVGLLHLKEKLESRPGLVESAKRARAIDATTIFEGTKNKVLNSGMAEKGKRVFAVKFPHASGLMNEELSPGSRFGKEVSAYVSGKTGCPGFFNTDEDLTDKYGFEDEMIEALKDELHAEDGDLVCFTCWGSDAPLIAVGERLASIAIGVPVETRKCLPDGTTRYMRPLPGEGRFYPETDIPPIMIRPESICTLPPVDLEVEKLRKLGLNEKLALDVLLSDRREVFDYATGKDVELKPTLVAGLLEEVLPSLRRDGVDIDGAVSEEKLCGLFLMMAKGTLTREAFPDAVRTLAAGGEYVPPEKGSGIETDVRRAVLEIILSRKEFVESEGMRALSGIMGLSMERFRGIVAGSVISRIVREELEGFLAKKK